MPSPHHPLIIAPNTQYPESSFASPSRSQLRRHFSLYLFANYLFCSIPLPPPPPFRRVHHGYHISAVLIALQPDMQPPSSQPPSPHNHSISNSNSAIPSKLPLKRSDLGSDEEWQLTMASDSDLDEPEQLPSNPPSIASHVLHPPSDNLNLTAQSQNSHETTYLHHITHPIVSHLNNPLRQPDPLHQHPYHHVSTLVPHFNNSLDLSISSKQQHHPEPAPELQPNELQPNDPQHHQIVLIPGYRGASSRDAVFNHPSPSPNPTETQSSPSTHSNRANPVPLSSPDLFTHPPSPQIPTSNELLPSQSPSTTSTHEKQHPKSTTLHHTKQTQSVQNNAPPPSTGLYRKPADKSLLQQHPSAPPTTVIPTSTPTATTSASPRNDSRQTSGIRATLRDSTARLTAARLTGPSRQSHPHNLAPDLPTYDSEEPNINLFRQHEPSRNLFVPLRKSPQYHIDATAGPRNPGYNYLNAVTEDEPYVLGSDQAQPPVYLGGPCNPAFYATVSNFGTPGASSSSTPLEVPEIMFPSSSVEPSHLPTHAGRARLQPVTKSTRNLSFLECIVEILRGCTISKRKYLLSTIEGEIWLTSNLKSVQYRMYKKGQPPVIQSIHLDDVRLVRGSERELSLEIIDRRKALQFIFQTQARSETWLSALSCVVPKHTTVMLRNKKLEMRETYDPMKDMWNGKPVATKKQLNNEYVILGTIGKGSFGKVKLALSRVNSNFYALKVIHKKDMLKKLGLFLQRGREGSGSQLATSEVNEIYVMQDLEHDNVIRFHKVYDAANEDRLYIALEFLSRGPVMRSSELKSPNSMSEEKARSVFVDVLGGLQYLHSKNIAHGDIKPDNLLQGGNGTVKISDFGAAIKYRGEAASQDAEEEHHRRQTKGTPAFSAPEICLSEHSPPRPARRYAADIWALGATLYYMVVGQVPFPAPSMFQIYDVICTESLRFPKGSAVSKNLRSLLEHMMQKLPEQRATFETIVESDWLRENVEVAERLAKIKRALLKQSNGTNVERRPGLASQQKGSVPPR